MRTSLYNTPNTPAGFREFCATAAIAMAEDTFTIVQRDDVSLTSKMEAAKWFAKMADYEPKASISANAGAGFQLIINYSTNSPKAMEVIGSGTTVISEAILDNIPEHVTVRLPRNAQFIDHDGTDSVHTA